MPLIILPSEKAGRGRGPGTGEGGFLPRSLASPSPEIQRDKFGFVGAQSIGKGPCQNGVVTILARPFFFF